MKDLKTIEYLYSEMPAPIEKMTAPNPVLIKLVKFGFSLYGRLLPRQASRLAYRLFSTPRIRARHKVSDPLLESARIFEFLYGRQILKGYEWGRGDRIVLLVHGWESRGTALRNFVPPLVEKGYRVIAFDGPAHGNSGGKRTNLPHFSGAIRAIINQVGGVESIITHSFGGASTVFALVNDPSLEVEKLVLIAVPNQMDLILQEAKSSMGLPEPAARHFKKIIEQKLDRPIQEVEIAKAFSKMKVGDALIIHDKKDQVVSFSSAEAIHRSWARGTLLVTEGYGHYQLIKNPEVINRVAGFIATPVMV